MDQLALFVLPSYCSVDGCSRPVKQKTLQLCSPHYRRHWRYGDPTAGGPERPRTGPAKPVQDFPDGTRICNRCDRRKPIDDFRRDSGGTGGRRSHCRACQSAGVAVWYADNQDRLRVLARDRRAAVPTEVRREVDRQRYENDKPRRIAYAVEATHRRRALMQQAELEPGITVKSLRKRHGDDCCYCGQTMTFAVGNGRAFVPLKATIEHIVALSKGGGHTWANTALACWQCNVRKNAKSLDEWRASSQVSDESAA